MRSPLAWVSGKHLLAWPVGFPLTPSSTWAGLWVGTLHMWSASGARYLPVCWPGFLSILSLTRSWGPKADSWPDSLWVHLAQREEPSIGEGPGGTLRKGMVG